MAQNQPTADKSDSFRMGGFEILEKIAEGGMGAVYRAHQTSLNRIVAVKFLHPRIAADAEYIESFRREAQAAARLQHPNIVSVIDAGEDGGLYFYAMEIVSGKTLFRWVQRDGALTEPTVIGIGVCVASGLKHAWDKERLIHRDLKPDNVMVDPDGNVKLCDLGLAKTVGEHSPSDGYVFGTPQYMSPEQARAEAKIDFRTDIYSLGITLYYALTAHNPFHGGAPTEVMKRHLNGQLPDPREFAPKTSLHICRVLEKMTAKPIAERYQTWNEVLRDFGLVSNRQAPQCVPPAEGKSTIHVSKHITQKRSAPASPLVIAQPAAPAPTASTSPPASTQAMRRETRIPILIVSVALIIGALGVFIAFLLNSSSSKPSSQNDAPRDSVVNDAPTAAKQWEDAIAFTRANQNNRDAIPEFAERLRKITQDFPGSPEANQAQMLLNFIAAQQQAALNAQNNNGGNVPNGFVPNLNFQPPWQWQQGQEPPWAQFVRPFINNAGPIVNWGLNMARQADQRDQDLLKRDAPPDFPKPLDPDKPNNTYEQRLKEEQARAKAATEFDARFARPYLAALSKRNYQTAIETARAAIGDPVFKPLRDDLKVANEGAKRLRQFWKTLPQLANTLKGRIVPFRGQFAKIVAADKNEITFETQPNVSFGIAYESFSTAELAAIALASTPNPSADNALDAAWFLFAEGRPLDAGQMLDTAQRNGADTASVHRAMGMLIGGAMETEADLTLKQLRDASEKQHWNEARVRLSVLNNHYANTKTAQGAAAQIKGIEGRIKKNFAPKPLK